MPSCMYFAYGAIFLSLMLEAETLKIQDLVGMRVEDDCRSSFQNFKLPEVKCPSSCSEPSDSAHYTGPVFGPPDHIFV